MRILAEATSEGGGGGCDEDDDEVLEPVVSAKVLEELLARQLPADKKLEAVALLARDSHAGLEVRRLRRQVKRQERQLRHARTSRASFGRGGNAGGVEHQHQQQQQVRGRVVTTQRYAPGPVIATKDIAHHPLSQSSRLLRLLIAFFTAYFFAQPWFIALSHDTVMMSLMFFVMTLMFAVLIGRQYWVTSEAELRLFYPEPEEGVEEQREPKFSYSLACFVAACFVQLIYALFSAAAKRVTWPVTSVVTLISAFFLILAWCLLIGFERARELAAHEMSE